LAPKTWPLTYLIATPVAAGIGASRHRLSVGTDDSERLGFLEGKSIRILQKDNALFSDFTHDTAMVDQLRGLDMASRKGLLGTVVLHIDLLIPGVGEVPTVEVGFGVALVLPNQVPSCEDSSSHVLGKFEYSKRVSMEVAYIDTRLRDGTILDVLHENVAEVGCARAKATRMSVSQGIGYASTKAYVISPGIVISRPDITDILHIITISHSRGRGTCNSRAMSCPPVGHYIASEAVLTCGIDKLQF